MSVVIATPAASGATSQARAKRLAARALAPQPVRGAFCLPPLLAGDRAVDKWYCAVWVDAPAGQQCTALVNVNKGRAKVTSPVTCSSVPAPLGSDKR
jgi:hypothetical protein